MLVAGGAASAQADDIVPRVTVDVDPECADRAAWAAFESALRLRLPRLVVAPTGDGSLAWVRGISGCELRVHIRADAAVIPFDAPSPAAVDAAAARVAWMLEVAAEEAAEEAAALAERPPPPPQPRPAPPDTAPPPAPHYGFAVSLAPSLALPTRATRRATRNASFNVLWGQSAGVTGGEYSIVGGQSFGPFIGAQIATVYAEAAGGLGMQLAGVTRTTQRYAGGQVGVVTIAGTELDGGQWGALNVAGDLTGAQFGAINIVRGPLTGGQWGALNVAGDLTGAQFGAINAAGRVTGAQFGAVTIARDADVAIGLLTIVREQPVRGTLTVDHRGAVDAGIRHGGRVVHTLWTLGIGPQLGDATMFSASWGIGAQARLNERWFVAPDLVFSALWPTGTSNVGAAGRVRVGFGATLAPRLALVGGVAANVTLLQDDTDVGWGGAATETDAGFVRAAPSAFVEARF